MIYVNTIRFRSQSLPIFGSRRPRDQRNRVFSGFVPVTSSLNNAKAGIFSALYCSQAHGRVGSAGAMRAVGHEIRRGAVPLSGLEA